MKILIVGCGSIGMRHAKNLASLGVDLALCESNVERLRLAGEKLGVTELYMDYKSAATESDAVGAVVATPSNLHTQPARALLECGKHILMEKPLCTDIDEAQDLKRLVEYSWLVFMMGHTYRFRAEWQAIKSIIDSEPLGRVYSAEFSGGWYLPDWHVNQNYRDEYAAQKRMGGGVWLTSMSHLFDIVSWYFGDITHFSGSRMRVGSLEMDVDDFVTCSMKTAKGAAVVITEDFLSRSPRRLLRISAENGFFEIDFNLKRISKWDARKKRFPPNFPFDIGTEGHLFSILEDGVKYDLTHEIMPLVYSGNDAYKAEMISFINAIKSGRVLDTLGIDAGINVLKLLNRPVLEAY